MSIRTDEVNLKVTINGDGAGKTLKEMRSEIKGSRAELENLIPGTKEFIEASKKLQDVTTKYNAIQKEVRGVGGSMKETSYFTDTFKGMLASLSVDRLVNSIIDFGKESITAFREAEVNAGQLKFAIENISGEGDGAFEQLIQQSEKWQKESPFSDDAIQQAQKALVQYGLNSNQVKKLIPDVINLAAAQKTNLEPALDKVISAINGQTKGLKDAGIQFEDTGSKTENLAILQEKLQKFAGAAGDAMEKSAGQAAMEANELDDLQEKVGEKLVPVFDALKRVLWDALDGVTSLFEKFDAGKKVMKEQQDQVASMTTFYEKMNDAQLQSQLRFSQSDLLEQIDKRKKAIEDGDKAAMQAANNAILYATNEKKAIEGILEARKNVDKVRDDATMKGQNEGEAAQKRFVENTKKMEAELAINKAQSIEDDLQRELALLDAKHVNKQKEISDTLASEKVKNEALKQETERFEKEKADILEKYYQEALDLAEKTSESKVAITEKEHKEELQKLQQQGQVLAQQYLNDAKNRVSATQKGTKERYEAELELLLREKQLAIAELDITKENSQQKLQIEQEFIDKVKALQEEAAQHRIELFKKIGESALAIEQEIMSAVQQKQQAETNNKLTELDKQQSAQQRVSDQQTKRELENLKQQLAQRKISQAQYEAYEKKILTDKEQRDAAASANYEAREREIRTRQAERQKNQAILQATIDGLAAVVKSFTIDPTGILAITTGILTGIKIAAIKSTPIPAFGDGGGTTDSFKGGGPIKQATLGIIGEKGPEWVAPNWMINDPYYSNVIGMLEQARVRGYAGGGSTSKTGSLTNRNYESTDTSAINAAAFTTIENNTRVMQYLIDNGVLGVWDWDYDQRTRKQMADIKKASSLGS